jgi:hypothetical protein
MKKFSLVALFLFMSLIFSFEIIHAQVQTNVTDKLIEIKEIRQSIRHHLRSNKKIEGEIEKKSKQIEKVLVRLPENSLVSQQVVDQELNPKLESIMTQLMQIGEYETISWKYLNTGNKQLKNKKYDAGIKSLKQADIALKEKNEAMIRFKEDLDEFLVFINSLQHK